MLEVLLVVTCLSTEPACKPAGRAYYASKPYISKSLKKARNKIVGFTGTWILYTAPVLVLAEDGTAQLRITRHINLQVAPKSGTLLFDYSF